jgi:hypothetical protein
MPKKSPIPESPLEDRPWPFTLEQDLKTFLIMMADRFQKNRSDSLPAFEALNYIAVYRWQKGDNPPDEVPVPWWVVQALAIGFNLYRDSAQSRTPMTLGEAYNLEGRGQGREPRIQHWFRQLRDIRIVSAIVMAQANGQKLEAALQKEVEKTGLSIGQVRRIWEKNREQASRLVRKLPTRITS